MSRGRELLGLLALVGLLSLVIRHRLHQKAEDDVRVCEANKQTLIVALELFSESNAGLYPRELRDLVPGYLPHIPTCPSSVPNRTGYECQFAQQPKVYSIFCRGAYHRPLQHAVSCKYDDLVRNSSILER